ncbi:MAG: hypothetical protein LUE98_14975 [Tannerellaceae bacterium]|nr:hypothetical protein [Tannerellaceae bacterium]
MSEMKVKDGSTRYCEELKKEAVRRYLSEKISIEGLHGIYGATSNCIRGWIHRYKDEVLAEYFNNDLSLTRMKEGTNKSLEKENERLKEELKLLRIQSEGYKYTLELASQEYGEDLLKKP